MSSVSRRVLLGLCCLVAAIGTGTAQASAPAPAVGSLTTEHMTDPLGIDTGSPQLGWIITSRGARSLAEQVPDPRCGRRE